MTGYNILDTAFDNSGIRNIHFDISDGTVGRLLTITVIANDDTEYFKEIDGFDGNIIAFCTHELPNYRTWPS